MLMRTNRINSTSSQTEFNSAIVLSPTHMSGNVSEYSDLGNCWQKITRNDKNNAILEIFSGAGGQDSQDWATMLLRMYERYCASKGFKTQILHQAFGDARYLI